MISSISHDFNVDLSRYKEFTEQLDTKSISCPFCHQFKMIRHAYYHRSLIVDNKPCDLNILRVICKECRHTHAILPSFVIPYQHLPIEVQHQLVSHPENVRARDLSETDYRRLRDLIKIWKQKLSAFRLSFSTPLFDLIRISCDSLQMCYLQLHKGSYFLKEINHIKLYTLQETLTLQ